MKGGLSTAQRASLASTLATTLAQGTSGSGMSLFQNNITPTPLVAVSDFVECDFVGYARKTGITSFVTFNDAPTGDEFVAGTVLQLFAATSIVTPQTAYGWYLTDVAGTGLLCWGLFDTPYTFNASGDKVQVYPLAKVLLNTGQYG